MIKKLQKIGNSRLEKPLLKLLKVDENDSVEIVPHEDGLLIKKVDVESAYRQISKKHRKLVDKLWSFYICRIMPEPSFLSLE